MGCGIATTSALILRVPGGHGTTCIGGGDDGAAAALSFTGSDSVLIVAVSSLVVAVGIAGAALDSMLVFSSVAVGVCAAGIDADIRIRVMATNEVTKYLRVDLKPCIYLSFFACA